MARKSTKKKSKKTPEAAERNRRIALVSAVVIGGGAVFAGAAMGVGELDRKASAFIVPTNPSVTINWPTDGQGQVWMPHTDRELIEKKLIRAVQGGKALSRSALEEAGLAMMQTGWLDAVPTVRWTSDGVIAIEAQWRAPVAAVRLGTREIVIDRDRHVLPLDYAIGESNQYFFLGIDARLPEVGEQWQGTDLEDGLALLFLLETEGLLEQVAGFDLGDGAESGTLRILTKRDAKIIWGAGPGRERPGEQPTGIKIDRLKALFNRSGLIDGGSEFVDIRGANILLQRREG